MALPNPVFLLPYMKVHFCEVAVSTLFLTPLTGTVRLVFKATSEGYVQARELDDRYQQAKRGRADWATARRRQEADARANQVLEADNSPRLFCHLATVSDMDEIERRVHEDSSITKFDLLGRTKSGTDKPRLRKEIIPQNVQAR
jgi:hypothetical protein